MCSDLSVKLQWGVCIGVKALWACVPFLKKKYSWGRLHQKVGGHGRSWYCLCYLRINIHEGGHIKSWSEIRGHGRSWDCLLPTNKYSWGRLHQSHKVRLEVTMGHKIACYPLINIHEEGCIKVTKWGWRPRRVMRLPLLSAVFKLWFFVLPKLEPLLFFPLFQTKDINFVKRYFVVTLGIWKISGTDARVIYTFSLAFVIARSFCWLLIRPTIQVHFQSQAHRDLTHGEWSHVFTEPNITSDLMTHCDLQRPTMP